MGKYTTKILRFKEGGGGRADLVIVVSDIFWLDMFFVPLT